MGRRVAVAIAVLFTPCWIILHSCAGFWEAQVRAKATTAESRLATLITGLEAYRAKVGSYPESIGMLTTPVCYISKAYFSHHSYPNRWEIEPADSRGLALQFLDPFLASHGVYYWSQGDIYILAFAGPDGQTEATILPAAIKATSASLNPREMQRLVCDLSYDPTNGVLAPGKDYIVLGPARAKGSFVPSMLEHLP